MARSFSTREARQLLQRHRDLAARLTRCCELAETQRRNVVNITNTLADRNVFASLLAVELLTGRIGEDVPPALHRLIHALDKFALSLPLSLAGSRLYQANQRDIDQHIARLKPAANSLQWLFTSRQGKEAAQDAYRRLSDIANSAHAWQVDSLTGDLHLLEQHAPNAALERFRQDSAAFRQALLQAMPDAPQLGQPLPEIATVVENHQALNRQMDAADAAIEAVREKIRTAAGQLITAQTLQTLRTVAVEELGHARPGIRFKALREHGYLTVADVFCATQPNLAAVYGVSEETARALKDYAQQYALQVRSGVRLRLSADDRSAEATRLVSALCEYRQRTGAINALAGLRSTHGSTVSGGLRSMQEVMNGILWVFTPPQEKQRLTGVYHHLAGLLHGKYAQDALRLIHALHQPLAITPEQAWADFQHHSIAFFNILESLMPGMLDGSDSFFGLPEELARAIQEQDFFPDGLRCSLRRYQEWGVKYILHQERVLLGDEMGLGKTVQAIAAMVSLRNTQATHFMVVCPASVIPNWCREIAEKSRLRVTRIHGAGRMNAFSDWQKNGGVAVTNFETTIHLSMADDFAFDMLVVDEAHYIKNAEARRSKGVSQLADHAGRVLFMTGTALENRVEEMIALIRLLRPEVASRLSGMAHLSAAPQFREAIAPVYYRRKRDDVLTELPELIQTNEWCTMSPGERAHYEASVLHDHFMTIRQLSWNMDDLNNSCKANRLKELIDDAAAEGRKVLVFSFFLDTIARIRDYLGPARCMQPITGALPPQRRQQIINEFDQAPAGAVLLSQIQSGGTGLNIQSASMVIMCEPQLKPSIESQAISRAYRMGQARNVLVHRLLCEDSIDERINDLLSGKHAQFTAFADQSVSAAATALEEAALDQQSLKQLIADEIDRINARAASGSQPK